MSGTVLVDPKGAGFDAPFEMLDACHDQVRRMLELLVRLREHLQAQSADAQAVRAAKDVMRYFDLAAPAHHEDEERHVFPALLAADVSRWSALVNRLQSDHQRMAAAWAEARVALDQVSKGRRGDATQVQAAAWPIYAALYVDHLVAEDQEVFPAAAKLMDARAQSAMGAEMAKRRGATLAPTA